MAGEVAGIQLDSLVEPIGHVLREYQHTAGKFLGFDELSASVLKLTPDKPNSARSKTEVVDYAGERVGDMVVIAFKPQDGTGDENTYRLDDLDIDPRYPRAAKAVPRSKSSAHTEICLPILSHLAESPNAGANLLHGTLDLLGLDDDKKRPRIQKIGELSASSINPHAVFTTGYRRASHERFGDPHAVFNSNPETIVVAGFLAVDNELVAKSRSKLDVLECLHPVEPRWTV